MVKTLFLHDSNNIKEVKDSFGIHTKIFKTIVDIANNESLNKCSFNLGLFGSWGSGKSYIINNIIKELKDNYAVFYIDVWKYVGHPLMRSILFDIDKQLKDIKLGLYDDGYVDNKGNSLEKLLYADTDFEEEIDLKWNEISNKLRPIVGKLLWAAIIICVCSAICHFYGNDWLKSLSIPIFSGLGFISAPLILIKFFENQIKDFTKTLFCNKKIKTYTYKPSFSPEQFESIFSDIITNISSEGKKVLIVFDNLDRCEPKYAYETLSAIKTFMDKENCLYIIPCDDAAIKKYICASYNINSKDNENFATKIGEEFFDKLFNTYIRIPQLQEIDRDKFIEEQLKELSIYEEIENNISEIKQILFYGYQGSTPRQIKRFINDFSLNYVLAKNIDAEKQFILKNLSLFAIMVVIKQKWNDVEEQLTKDADLYSENIENENYKLFIEKVKNLLPYNMPSIMPFIYMKATVDAKLISNKLKEGQIINEINDSIVNRVKTEITYMKDKNETSYLQQSSYSIFDTLKQDSISTQNNNSLIKILGEILVIKDIDLTTFITRNIEFIDCFITCLPIMMERDSKTIKENISQILKMNSMDDELGNYDLLDHDKKVKLFNSLIKAPEIFEEEYVSKIFKSFKQITQVDESMHKFVEILAANSKLSLVPEEFLHFIINSIAKDSYSDNTLNCLNKYNQQTFPKSCKKMLSEKLNILVSNIKTSASTYANNISVLEGIKISLKLINKESFDNETLNSFNSALYTFINNLFPYAAKFGMDLLVEAMPFVDASGDSTYENILRQYLAPIDNQNIFVGILKDNEYSEYVLNVLQYPKIKQFLLGNRNMVKDIYFTIKNLISEKYDTLLPDSSNGLENLKLLLDVIRENEINIDTVNFKTYIIDKYFDEENLELTYNLFELLSSHDIKVAEQDFVKIKNKTIDCYKKDTNSGLRYLSIAQNILTEKQFNKIFISPIFNYISSELDSTNSVSKYSTILILINEIFIQTSTKIIKDIIAKLLEDNQEVTEYEFACKLLKLLYEKSIDISEFQEIVLTRKSSFNSATIQLIDQIFA